MYASPPPTAQGFIKLDDAQDFFKTQARKIKLSLEQIAVRIQRVELRVDSAAVSEIRQSQTALQCCEERFLLRATFMQALMGDQGVGGFGECSLDCLFVMD